MWLRLLELALEAKEYIWHKHDVMLTSSKEWTAT
jgi:hypothetical protein